MAPPGVQPQKASARAQVRRFWPLTRRFQRYLWVMGSFWLLGVPLALLSPWIIKHLVDQAEQARDPRGLFLQALLLMGLTALSVIFGICTGFAARLFHNRVSHAVRLRLFRHVQRLSLSSHGQRETGYLMARLNDDVVNLDGIMGDALLKAGIDAVKVVAFLIMLFVLEPRLAAGGCLLVLVVFLVEWVIARPLRRLHQEVQERQAELGQSVHQGLSGHLLTKATATERQEARRYAGVLKAFVKAALRRDLFALWSNHLLFLITGVAPTLIILAGAFLIAEGSFTVGGLFAFFMFLVQMAGAVADVARFNPALQSSAVSARRIFEILDSGWDLREPPSPRHLAPLRGAVALRGVTFGYREGRPVLRDIDFSVEPGTRVALVGPSGAGKSSLVALIPRFHDPDQGRVLVDGVDVRELALRELRQSIGLVPQEIFLFDRTVRENISLGVPDPAPEDLERALDLARASAFVAKLPEGLDTVVGERGITLSGGQRQRLAMAREILRDPAILILDEATSSLDSRSEALIQEALESLLKKRTSFIIAHRLSSVMTADIILVMEQGRIVERGRHQDLLRRGGLYASLFRAQAFSAPHGGAFGDGS